MAISPEHQVRIRFTFDVLVVLAQQNFSFKNNSIGNIYQIIKWNLNLYGAC